jgi:hypothetical protein
MLRIGGLHSQSLALLRGRILASAAALALITAIGMGTSVCPTFAQELEPRAFSAAPVGLNIALLSYGFSTGSLLFDQSLPIDDATVDVNSVTGVYVRSINFFGASAKVAALAPFFIGDWRGNLEGEPAFTSRTGFGDPRLRLTVSFLGAPALEAGEFSGYRQKTVLGAGLNVIVPLGQYDASKIVNLGSNRWSFKAAMGGAQAVGRWTFELLASAWLFTTNEEFLNGTTLKQDPIFDLQGHILYTARPWLWLGLDGGYGTGGQTTVDDVAKDSKQNSSRMGATLGFTLSRRHGLKLAYVSAVSTRIGADFDTIVAAYQYRWGGGI